MAVKPPVRSDSVSEEGRGGRGEGDAPVYVGCGKLASERAENLTLVVGGNRPDK